MSVVFFSFFFFAFKYNLTFYWEAILQAKMHLGS